VSPSGKQENSLTESVVIKLSTHFGLTDVFLAAITDV